MHVIAVEGIDEGRALFAYDGAARRVVTGLKYANDRRLLSRLADAMAGLLAPPSGAVVTWIPTTPERQRRRGFDQAALLARAVARRWRAPCTPVLERATGPPQTGRSLADRRHGVGLTVCRGVELAGTPVVLVDDVVTSGATLRSGAAALRAAGTPWVGAVTVARTPRSR